MRVAINVHKAADDLPPRIDAIGRRSIGSSIWNIERDHLACRKDEAVAHSRLVRIPIADNNPLRLTERIGIKRAG